MDSAFMLRLSGYSVGYYIYDSEIFYIQNKEHKITFTLTHTHTQDLSVGRGDRGS